MSGKKDLERLRSNIISALKGLFNGATPVFGQGQAPCVLMVVGEAPGRDEVKQGKPFVGKAGRFLISVLKETLGMEREEIYITNAVKIWPKIETRRVKTRKPAKEEEDFFRPYLMEEIKAVRPRVILAVGKTALRALAPDEDFTPGRWVPGPCGSSVMPVYHPSYILRRQKSLDESTEAMRSALREVKKRLPGC